MKDLKFPTEHTLYWLAFALALFLRLFRLGAAPLSDIEAGWALQALDLARSGTPVLGAQSAYIILTSQLFSIFGDTNFIARLLPALAGSLLVWVPFMFRGFNGSEWLKRASLIMAFGLAVDPGLIALSRQVGSPIPALAFTLLAFACLYNRRMIGFGIFAGLAVLSGPAFLQGALILGLSYLLFRVLRPRLSISEGNVTMHETPAHPGISGPMSVALFSFLGTLLVAGTLFLRVSQGLSALANTIPAYFSLWMTPSGIPPLRLPASLLVYQPLAILFGLVGLARLWLRSRDDPRFHLVTLGLTLWTLLALSLPLAYPGRQVGDMAWLLIPLWAFASLELSRSFLSQEDSATRLVAAGLGLLLFVLAVVAWMNLLAIGRYQVNVLFYWALVLGSLLLGLIAILLVATTWSAPAASLGLVWALCVVLGLQLVSNIWGVAVLRPNGAQELWSVSPATAQADLFMQTLSDLSTWNTGLKDQVQVVVLTDLPSLKWGLRDLPNARYESIPTPGNSPAVVITPKETALAGLSQDYRGQDFIWQVYPGWSGVFPPNFINWLAFRQAPLNQEQIILWARADIFPGGTLKPSENTVP